MYLQYLARKIQLNHCGQLPSKDSKLQIRLLTINSQTTQSHTSTLSILLTFPITFQLIVKEHWTYQMSF